LGVNVQLYSIGMPPVARSSAPAKKPMTVVSQHQAQRIFEFFWAPVLSQFFSRGNSERTVSHHKDPWYLVVQQEPSGHRRVIKHCFLLRRVIKCCFQIRRVSKCIFLRVVVASTMKPILQLIDMEESDPGALLNNEHPGKAAKKPL